MDDDLRTLERRAAADPTLQPLLRKARERAGLGRSLELRSIEADELHAAVEAGLHARNRWHTRRHGEAEARVRALRSCLTGAFVDQPGLVEVTLDWRLVERTTGPWTVALRVHVPRTGHRTRNALHPDDARALEVELLRHALVLPRRHELFGARRVRRFKGAEDPLLLAEELVRHEVGVFPWLDASGLEVPMRLVEDLDRAREANRFRADPLEPGVTFMAGEGTQAGARRLADGADLDRADDDAELLCDGAAAWERFVTALFAEHRELDLFVLQGWTYGYNDNWHDEHEQRLFLDGNEMTWLPEVWDAPLPDELLAAIQAQARRSHPSAVREALRAGLGRDFDASAFGPFLRLRHGHDWLLVLRRDGDHVVERLLRRPEASR